MLLGPASAPVCAADGRRQPTPPTVQSRGPLVDAHAPTRSASRACSPSSEPASTLTDLHSQIAQLQKMMSSSGGGHGKTSDAKCLTSMVLQRQHNNPGAAVTRAAAGSRVLTLAHVTQANSMLRMLRRSARSAAQAARQPPNAARLRRA